LNQKDERSFVDPEQKYDFSTARILLGKIGVHGLTYVDGQFFCDRNIVLENILDAGYYIITIEVNWVQDFMRAANISNKS